MNGDYTRVPTFEYTSAFSYRSDFEPIDDYTDNDNITKYSDPIEKVAYFLLVTLSFLFFLLTIPVSSLFCIKKVNSLQRCLTHRLGRRLPLKGPGFILKLPFVDHITIINLLEDHFSLNENDQQLLTSDGSIIVLRPCQASLNITDAVLTTLRVGSVNVKNCLQLRFANSIRSKHVDDLENKMDHVARQFEENSNRFLKKWGYSIKLIETPRITVEERADPFNPIKSKLQKLFGQDDNVDSSNKQSIADDILNFLNPMASLNHNVDCNQIEQVIKQQVPSNQIVPVLQTFVNQYQYLLIGYSKFNIKLTIKDSTGDQISHFKCEDGIINCLATIPKSIQMKIDFDDQNKFEQFLSTKDIKYLNYSFT